MVDRGRDYLAVSSPGMDSLALTASIYNFEITLSDVDRNVYEPIAFKAAQQPSETDEYLVARVLAYALEYTEGIGFSGGIAEADQPAIFVRDMTGALKAWIDIGSPDANRLHKASKAAPRRPIPGNASSPLARHSPRQRSKRWGLT